MSASSGHGHGAHMVPEDLARREAARTRPGPEIAPASSPRSAPGPGPQHRIRSSGADRRRPNAVDFSARAAFRLRHPGRRPGPSLTCTTKDTACTEIVGPNLCTTLSIPAAAAAAARDLADRDARFHGLVRNARSRAVGPGEPGAANLEVGAVNAAGVPCGLAIWSPTVGSWTCAGVNDGRCGTRGYIIRPCSMS